MPPNMGRRHLVTGAAVTALLLACLSGTASGFSQGSPDTTCRTMEPLHGVSRQITPAPFTITPSVVEIEGGKQMEVTLEAGQGASFKGFLVEGRSAETQDVVGTFFTEDHKYLNCDNGVNNAVTHRGPAAKSKVAIKWEPPSDFSGDVVFTASFVQERTVFWVGVTSEKVTVKRSAPAPPAPETTTTTSTTTSTASTPAVSPATEIDLKENAGDVVINVVEAPSGVLKNDTSVVTPEGDSSPSSLSPTSPSTPISTPSEVSTVSSDSSVGEGEEEAEETPLPDITTPKPKPKPKPGPKRKFGLLGRRRTTTTTTVAPSTTTATTTSQPKGEEKLSPVSTILQEMPFSLLHLSVSINSDLLQRNTQMTYI